MAKKPYGRAGQITITREEIDDNRAQAILAEISMIESGTDPITGSLHVIGLSRHFDDLTDHGYVSLWDAPRYDIIFDWEYDDSIGNEVERTHKRKQVVRFIRRDEAGRQATDSARLSRALLRMIKDLPVYFKRSDLEALIKDLEYAETDGDGNVSEEVLPLVPLRIEGIHDYRAPWDNENNSAIRKALDEMKDVIR